MCPFSCAITQNKFADLEFHAMIRNTKKKMIISRLEHSFSMKSKSS